MAKLLTYNCKTKLLQWPWHESESPSLKHKADKHKVPETKNTEEGSARRNITRKHDHDPH
ncbi:hypothetical protein THAOC_23637, partial [Thalassiosira oceanica]